MLQLLPCSFRVSGLRRTSEVVDKGQSAIKVATEEPLTGPHFALMGPDLWS